MRIRPREHQRVAEIVRDELQEASRRIGDRLSEIERQPVAAKDDSMGGVRSFYRDLTDNDWTEADEETLASLEGSTAPQVKALMRDAFRRSRVHPQPSFASLINVARKGPGVSGAQAGAFFGNPDAVPAAERERIASLLHRELREAAGEIATKLNLTDNKAQLVRQQLEDIEGAIISEFTPLV
ncbi:MAG TPA: hypothetical protein VLM38_24695 [Blastocatellia bacterium]|nr:hypothetical protein [Blastocatellia bacterium]